MQHYCIRRVTDLACRQVATTLATLCRQANASHGPAGNMSRMRQELIATTKASRRRHVGAVSAPRITQRCEGFTSTVIDHSDEQMRTERSVAFFRGTTRLHRQAIPHPMAVWLLQAGGLEETAGSGIGRRSSRSSCVVPPTGV